MSDLWSCLHDFWRFIEVLAEGWVWWMTSSLIAAGWIIWSYYYKGRKIPHIYFITLLILCLIGSFFSAWRTEHKKADAAYPGIMNSETLTKQIRFLTKDLNNFSTQYEQDPQGNRAEFMIRFYSRILLIMQQLDQRGIHSDVLNDMLYHKIPSHKKSPDDPGLPPNGPRIIAQELDKLAKKL